MIMQYQLDEILGVYYDEGGTPFTKEEIARLEIEAERQWEAYLETLEEREEV